MHWQRAPPRAALPLLEPRLCLDPNEKSSTLPREVQDLPQVNRRYQVLTSLGRGGMGEVWRARDRLEGRDVALKFARLGVPDTNPTRPSAETFDLDPASVALIPRAQHSGATDLSDRRMVLTNEFALLAGLRHPHVISVLDYGFAPGGRPFYTMELVDDGQTLVAAARSLPLHRQVELLCQLLEALGYLHRHGIVHRDLKPSNILVKDGVLKVLDFGLSRRSTTEGPAGRVAGTLAYMAPELLDGAPATPGSDLYAVGVLAVEVLTGRALFKDRTPDSLPQAAAAPPEIPEGDLHPGLVPVVRRLLTAAPSDRYAAAAPVIDAMRGAIGLPPAPGRGHEHLVRAPRFVGRSAELARLEQALEAAVAGRSRGVLVIGESGVGKSRLMREFRTRALVRGAQVITGQAVEGGAGAYETWRAACATLLATGRPRPVELATLAPLVPDAERFSPDGAPLVELAEVQDASQLRILEVIEALLGRQSAPTVLMFEDLQWAGSDSVHMLAALHRRLGNLPVLMVGSVRDGEGFSAEHDLPDFASVKLGRLADEEVAELSGAILGARGRAPEVVAALQQQTAGNPFFVVEVVQALAERAGGLHGVEADAAADLQWTEGIATVVQRAFARVPEPWLARLETAALAGGALDPALMAAIAPEIDWSTAVGVCVDAAVLTVRDDRCWFAHDKLREWLVARVEREPADQRAERHRTLATAIAAVYGERADKLPALARHWGAAGDTAREAHFCALAGKAALDLGACDDAIAHLSRAAELGQARAVVPAAAWRRFAIELFGGLVQPHRGSPQLELARVQALITEATSQKGEQLRSLEHARRALALYGQPMPGSRAGLVLGAAGQLVLRAVQAAWRSRFQTRDADAIALRRQVTDLLTRVTEISFYTEDTALLLWAATRALNVGAPGGPSPGLAKGWVGVGLVLGIAGRHGLARSCCDEALAVADAVGEPYVRGFVGQRAAVYTITRARWTDAEAALRGVLEIAERVQNPRQILEATAIMALARAIRGDFASGVQGGAEVAEMSRRYGDVQVERWGIGIEVFSLLRQGEVQTAGTHFDHWSTLIDDDVVLTDRLWRDAYRALWKWKTGDRAAGRAGLEAALVELRGHDPVAWWLHHPLTVLAELSVEVLAADGDAEAERMHQAALDVLCVFSKRFVYAEASLALWRGAGAAATGQADKARALLTEAAEAGRRLEMRFEQDEAARRMDQGTASGRSVSARDGGLR